LAVTDNTYESALLRCEEAFDFLTRELGFARRRSWTDRSGFELVYASATTGVTVSQYARDPFTVQVCRLQDGEFPPPPRRNTPDEPMHCFDLTNIEQLTGTEIPVEEIDLYTFPSDEVIHRYANSLRGTAADLLRGDFTRWPELTKRANERTRAHMIGWLGAERAKEEGWE
jgi:hypothetical protein